MDFGTLLQTAKENEHTHNKKGVRVYNTKFTPPKKEEKKAKTLSTNIQKFLARKEAEEKRKHQEANRKRDELLALRSKDRKATRRVNVMLKRTKSANQSVIEDAVDNDNTAITLAGPSQPDEDDYGYVSQEAAAFYNKMMEKYNKMPDDPKFPVSKKKASNNLNSTKDRVKAALEREKEEALLPHRRKRKHQETSGNDIESNEKCSNEFDESDISEVPVKAKLKLNPAPVINFTDLLKLAAQKQHEPIMIEVKPKEEEGPLLTKKQKREMEKERQRKEAKLQNNKISTEKSSTQPAIKMPVKLTPNNEKFKKPISQEHNNHSPKLNGKIPKSNLEDAEYNPAKPKLCLPTVQNMKGPDTLKLMNDQKNCSANSIPSKRPLSKSNTVFKKPSNDISKRSQDFNISNKKSNIPSRELERKILPNKDLSNSSQNQSNSKFFNKPTLNTENQRKQPKLSSHPKELNRPKSLGNIQSKETPNIQPKKFPSNDLKPKQFTQDVKPKQLPPSAQRKDINRKPILNKRRIMDDDEYDSEMDDFIDDGSGETADYSKYIKDIFGYDKSKYRGIDEDDVDNMESSFAQQMKEDVRSTRLGIMEDLEDIKREKEEKRLKALMKKRKL